MPFYAKVVNGVVRGITQTAAPISNPSLIPIASFDASLLGATYSNGVFTPSVVKDSISASQFWKRFSQAEREALANILAIGTQSQKNKLNAFRDYVLIGGNVELDDDYIVGSLILMEQANVIGDGRAAEILA
jgi:hypothetical protein